MQDALERLSDRPSRRELTVFGEQLDEYIRPAGFYLFRSMANTISLEPDLRHPGSHKYLLGAAEATQFQVIGYLNPTARELCLTLDVKDEREEAKATLRLNYVCLENWIGTHEGEELKRQCDRLKERVFQLYSLDDQLVQLVLRLAGTGFSLVLKFVGNPNHQILSSEDAFNTATRCMGVQGDAIYVRKGLFEELPIE